MTVDATPRERLEILRNSRTVALVGVSPNPLRSSNFVATYLTRTPYTVWPVNPNADEVLGKKSYPSLSELPEAPDGERRPVADVRDRLGRTGHDLVHARPPALLGCTGFHPSHAGMPRRMGRGHTNRHPH